MRNRLRALPIGISLGLVLAGTFIVSIAEGHVSGEIRGGYYTDADEAFIGGGLNTDVGGHWYFNPNLEYVFVDGYDYMTMNADFHRDLAVSGPAVWLGGGPALIYTNPNTPPGVDSNSDVDLGLNLIAGMGARSGSARPFGQFKVTVSDNSEASLAMGIRF